MTYKQAEANMARNNVLDRIIQGAGAFILLALAYQDLMDKYIHASYPANYILAGGAIVFLVYVVVAPLFRK